VKHLGQSSVGTSLTSGSNFGRRQHPSGLTQQDIDVAVSITKNRYPDLNMGGGPPIPDLPANGNEAAHSNLKNQGNQTNIPGRDGRIHLNENYLKCLSDAEALDLLDTIIHESEHFTRPAAQQVPPDYDHTFIVPDTARRVQRIKNDYMKALAKARKKSPCGCPQ
jgi:hypothetical protein